MTIYQIVSDAFCQQVLQPSPPTANEYQTSVREYLPVSVNSSPLTYLSPQGLCLHPTSNERAIMMQSLTLSLLTLLPALTVATPILNRPALLDPNTLIRKDGSSCPVVSPELSASPKQPPPYLVSLSSAKTIEVGFSMPPSATTGPCSLMLDLSTCSVQGSAKINVYALDGPDPGGLLGTAMFAAGSKATINSFACREQMCFRLEAAEEDADGSVEFTEATGGVGLGMTYGC
ncbi:hypothetical protein QBC35DRAFT_507478 [Podospora australis]|uniref:Uncharacterized protein n=1 Tax=Podospora australis TaxID=1536484 RepID=A0AAN7AE02_9PEZI|nr:hypothetical protein QBC35DRAFT_507478 [Podospora australis]